VEAIGSENTLAFLQYGKNYDRKSSIVLAPGGRNWLVIFPISRNQLYDSATRGQCYKTNFAAIYCLFRLNYHRNIYNIEFTLE
jgi:hypothetical protein